MSQVWEIGDINPATTSPLTDISRLTRSMDALHSLFSGPNSPQVTVPYMFWADTAEGILKRRNAENSSWVFALSLTESFIKNINTSYTTLVTDNGSMLLVDAVSAPITINLISASSARAGSVISIKKIDNTVNIVTLNPNASETIDGDINYQLQITHETIILRSDGNNWRVVNLYRPRVVLTKAIPYGITKADDKAVINASIAVSTIFLPLITAVHNGFSVTVKKLVAGVTTIAINGSTIDGLAINKQLTAINQAMTFISNGLGWFTISEANAPVTQNFATIAQMKAQTAAQIIVNPSGLYYSPSSVQVAARFDSLGPIIKYSKGCIVSNGPGIGRTRITFTNPYVNKNTYASIVSGSVALVAVEVQNQLFFESQVRNLNFIAIEGIDISVMASGQLI